MKVNRFFGRRSTSFLISLFSLIFKVHLEKKNILNQNLTENLHKIQNNTTNTRCSWLLQENSLRTVETWVTLLQGNVPLRSEVKLQGSGYWITFDTDCTGKESCPTWQDIWEYKTDEHVSQGKNGKETISYNCLWTFALSQVMLHLT